MYVYDKVKNANASAQTILFPLL